MMKEQSMTSKSSDISSQGSQQGDNVGTPTHQPGPPEHLASRSQTQVFKSGPLFISSKGIGWTSWKKRWFILTRSSLVFYRSNPSQAPLRGGDMNLTLGGIDLYNSATVDVKADKKLLTVFFPDGRDGRVFTLKAETSEDLQEWKTALENALTFAPSAPANAGQNGLIKSEQSDDSNGAADEQKDGTPGASGKYMVLGRPVLLALEEMDGSPSFLEKALRFIEDHGVKVEGVLRQAADVDEVYHRVHEYEQGKTEFSPNEDAHIIGDCIKYILRELPSSPVPASCCNALLQAFRTERHNRVNAMRTAILETFPEPNRRLLQRILQMMQIVASNKNVNRMSTSAVAACMSPLLLRPLLAGECELGDTHMDVAGDGSFQLLQAAAAANHAQAIIITLLDEYDKIFGDGSMSDSGLFSDSDESGSGTEEASDDDIYEDDDDYLEDEDNEDVSDDHEETDDESEHSEAESYSGSGTDHGESDSNDDKHSERSRSVSKSPKAHSALGSPRSLSASPRSPEFKLDHSLDDDMKRNDERSAPKIDSTKLRSITLTGAITLKEPGSQMSETNVLGASQVRRQRWGRTSAKKNLSMESIDFQVDAENEIEILEAAKHELQSRIEEEASGNSKLQASLEARKKALHERRLALEKDVTRLQEQLQRERDLRATLEAESAAKISRTPEKTKVDHQKFELAEEKFSNLKQRLDDIDDELHHQHHQTTALLMDRNIEVSDSSNQGTALKKDELHHRVSCKFEGQQRYKTDGNDHDHDQKNQSSKKNQNQPSDIPRGGSSKFGWFSGNSASTEASIPKPSPFTSRKSSIKAEGISITTSGLSKLTNRLNILKEKRTQLANELQSIDKGCGSSTQPVLSPGKVDKNPGLSKKVEDRSSGKGSSTAVDKNQSVKGSSSKSEASSSIDRLKSEGQSSSRNSEKGR